MPQRPACVPQRFHEFMTDVANAALAHKRPEDRFGAMMSALRWSADPEMSQRLRDDESVVFTRWVKLYSAFYNAATQGEVVALPNHNWGEMVEMCLAIICFWHPSHPLPENLLFLSTAQNQ